MIASDFIGERAGGVFAVLLLVSACRVGPGEEKGTEAEDPGETDPGEDSDSVGDVDSDSDTDSDTDTDTDTDTDADTDSDTDTDTADYSDKDYVSLEGEMVETVQGSFDWETWTDICTGDYLTYSTAVRIDCPDCVFAFDVYMDLVDSNDSCIYLDFSLALGYSQSADPKGMINWWSDGGGWVANADATFDGEVFTWYLVYSVVSTGTGYSFARFVYDGQATVR